MKTILVINDYSACATNALKMTLAIGRKLKADILVANTVFRSQKAKVRRLQLAGEDAVHETAGELAANPLTHSEGYESETINLDVSDFTEEELAGLVIKNYIWMMVKGIAEDVHDDTKLDSHLNTQGVLNRVRCPLLLVPENFKPRDFERVTYVADLRYCRLQVVKFLVELGRPYNALLQIANMAAKGLPEMEPNYANSFFNDMLSIHIHYDNLILNNIKEKDLQKAVDVMINTLHTDLLVLVNHRFHFEEIFGRHLPDLLPKHITIPQLIFPC